MNTIIKSTIAACGFLAAASAPLTAGAETFNFSGKSAFGYSWGYNGNLYLDVSVFESTTQSKSDKTGSSGAYVYGSYFTGTECWFGYGSTDAVELNVTGTQPNKVTASGTASVTWYEYCTGSYSVVTDSVTFNENLTALKDQTSSNWGNNHYEYGNFKVNYHYDYSYAPASVNDSSFSSQNFGSVAVIGGSVGQSKSHDVQIIK